MYEQHNPDKQRILRMAMFRFMLGNAQMFCAAVTLILLICTGVSTATIALATVSAALTLTSLMIFRHRK